MGSTLRRPLLASITLLLIAVLAATFRLYKLDKLPPPSLHYDEAYYAVDAIHVMQGQHVIFFPGNNGHEPLYIYLEAIMFQLFGTSAITARVLSALIGIATVLATYWAGSELFWRDQAPNITVGLLAALCLAGLFWHISFSRQGLRVITMPLFTALALAALARSLRTKTILSFIGTGLLLGLCLYTYTIVRIFPFVVVMGFLLWWVGDSENRKKYFVGLAIVTAVSALVFAPLGIYFIQHPWTFWSRTATLWDTSQPAVKIIQILEMFFVKGETAASANVSGRPAFDVFQALAFVAGLFACVAQPPRRRGLLVFTWLAIMLLPNMLTEHSDVFLHALGTIPALAIIMGAGLAMCLNWAARLARTTPGAKSRATGGGVLLLLGIGVAWSTNLTYWDYFHRWPQGTDLALAFEEPLSAIGSFVRQLPADESIYISPFAEPPPALVFAMHGDDPRVKVYDGRSCTVVKSTPNIPLTYIVNLSDPFTLPFLTQAAPGGQLAHTEHFSYYRVTPTTPITIQPQHTAMAVFGDIIKMEGYDAALRSKDGRAYVELAFYWRALQPIAQPYTMFVHLMSSTGELVAQHDNMPCEGAYATTQWSAQEIVIDRYELWLPDDLPPGSYQLYAGVYHSHDLERLGVTTELANADNVIELPGAIQTNAP